MSKGVIRFGDTFRYLNVEVGRNRRFILFGISSPLCRFIEDKKAKVDLSEHCSHAVGKINTLERARALLLEKKIDFENIPNLIFSGGTQLDLILEETI